MQKTKFDKSHHWPNIVAHFLIGILGAAFFVHRIFLLISGMKNDGDWQSTAWLLVLFYIVVIFFLIRMAWSPIGYLQEIELEEEYLAGKNFFGSNFQIEYSRIKSCTATITTPSDPRRRNPAVVLKTDLFPFHLQFNMKGYGSRDADNLSKAVNLRMERHKPKRDSPKIIG